LAMIYNLALKTLRVRKHAKSVRPLRNRATLHNGAVVEAQLTQMIRT
jgi:hypothetical protein